MTARTLLVLTALLALCWPAPAPAQTDTESAGLIDIVNAARAGRRMPPLRYEARLSQIADALTQALFQGQPLDALEDGVERLLRDKGYPQVLFGAHVAVVDIPAEEMIRGWLDGRTTSVLVDPRAQEIGVSYMSSKGSPVPDLAPNIWAVVVAEPAKAARDGWNRRILDYVNQFRARNGLAPLQPNAFLDRAALRHAQDMVRRDFFSHVNPDGVGPGQRARVAGYEFTLILENLASGQRSAREAVEAWIASRDGHREAMLNSGVTELGIGYVFAPYDAGRIQSRHYWSMTLGRPPDQ